MCVRGAIVYTLKDQQKTNANGTEVKKKSEAGQAKRKIKETQTKKK